MLKNMFHDMLSYLIFMITFVFIMFVYSLKIKKSDLFKYQIPLLFMF